MIKGTVEDQERRDTVCKAINDLLQRRETLAIPGCFADAITSECKDKLGMAVEVDPMRGPMRGKYAQGTRLRDDYGRRLVKIRRVR